MKPISCIKYDFDANNCTVLHNQSPVGCVAAADRLHQISNKSFGFFQRLQFYALDFLSHFSKEVKEKQFTEVVELCEKNDWYQQLYLQSASRLGKYVKENFNTLSSNVESLADAEVVCLAEASGKFSHRLHNSVLIDLLSEPGDLLLVEHLDQAKYLRKSLRVKEWDPLTSEEPLVVRSSRSVEDPDKISTNLFGKYPVHKGEVIGDLEFIEDEPKKTSEILPTIEANSRKGRRVYLVAEKGHFEMLKSLNELGNLKEKKYAVLIPKNRSYIRAPQELAERVIRIKRAIQKALPICCAVLSGVTVYLVSR